MVLNLDAGTLSFRSTNSGGLGIAFNNLPKGDKALCVMASATAGDSHVQMKYRGSEGTHVGLLQKQDPKSFPEPADPTFYTFHSKCGENAEVLFGGKMARRVDADDKLDNAVVVTSQPLEDGELFQVRLESKASKGHGSLEIGVTTIPASQLSFPSSMTDVKIGVTFMWSGQVIFRNGKEFLDLGHDYSNITVGDRIGLKIDAGKFRFYFNDRCLPQEISLSEVPSKVYGVVDICGQAERITILGSDRPVSRLSIAPRRKEVVHSATPLSIMMGMRSTIDALRDTALDVAMVANEIDITILKPYYASDGDAALRTQYGDHLADLAAAEEFAKVLKRLSEGAAPTDEGSWKAEQNIRLACWNYSNVSVKMAVQIGQAGLLSVFLDDLDKYGIPRTKNEKHRFNVLSALNVLHNCAKAIENGRIYRDLKALGRIAKFLKSDDKEYVMVAALTVSYICEDDQMDSVEMDTRAAKHILSVLKRALDSPDLYGRADESGYSVLELTQGLSQLAINDQNKATLMECGALPMMTRAATRGGPMEQEHAADVMWRLAQRGEGARKKVEKDAAETLTRLKRSNSAPVQEAAQRVLFTIQPNQNLVGGGRAAEKREPTDCEYRSLCQRFLATIDLKADFFNPKYDSCYCESCRMTREDFFYYYRGEPAMIYGLPVGWCRFGLHIHRRRAGALRVFQDWHIAYHGTTVGSIKPILQTGELLLPGDVAYGGKQVSEGEGHFNDSWKPKGFDTKHIFMSPSIRYAGIDCYSKPHTFTDSQTGRTYQAQVAFQMCVRPASYKVGKDTVGVTYPLDPRIDNQNIEWYTKERGAIFLYGLLVRLA